MLLKVRMAAASVTVQHSDNCGVYVYCLQSSTPFTVADQHVLRDPSASVSTLGIHRTPVALRGQCWWPALHPPGLLE